MADMAEIEKAESRVHDGLVAAWNAFVKLPATHPDDINDFRRAVHECQRILAVRELRRSKPDFWLSYPS